MKKASLQQVARLGGGYTHFIGYINNYGTLINVSGGASIYLPGGVVIAPGATGVIVK